MKKLISNKYANFYLNAAVELGLKYRIINERIGLCLIYNNKKELHVCANVLDLNVQFGSSLSDNKSKTSILLGEVNIPVPAFTTFEEAKKAKSYVLEHTQKGENLVIKPMNGSLSMGITINPSGKAQIYKAVKEAFEGDRSIIVEKYIVGKHYRVTVLDDEVIAVTQRLAANITGNGVNTVKELIEVKNIQRKMRALPPILLRKKDLIYLEKEQIKLTNIYPQNINIILQLGCDLDFGGERVRVDRKTIPKVNLDLFVKAVKTLRMRFAGIDYISPDITTPYTQIETAINELNSAPDFDVHYRDSFPHDNYAAERIVEKFFSPKISRTDKIVALPFIKHVPVVIAD